MMSVNDEAQPSPLPTEEPTSSNPTRPLTRQELHVLDFLAQGYTNEDIAHSLNIAVSTVSSHVQHILKKLQVRNRVEAVLYMRYHSFQLATARTTAPVAFEGHECGKSVGAGSAPLGTRDPLLFLSQLNHVNWRIAERGPLHIDYFGLAGKISMAFYDPYNRKLKVHIAIYGVQTGEMNAEVDELLWKYILDVAEVMPGNSFASAFSAGSQSPAPMMPGGARIDTSE